MTNQSSKKVLWIDKDISNIKMIMKDTRPELYEAISYFDNFSKALNNSHENIRLVVSGYCDFFWAACYTNEHQKNLQKEHFCFHFYDEIQKKNPGIPFILFSGFIETTEKKIESFEKNNKSFRYIPKYENNNFQLVANLINETSNL